MTDERNERIDFSPLDPTQDQASFERAVGAMTEAAAFELARRRAETSAILQIGRWRRPMWAVAAIIAAVSFTVLTRLQTPDASYDESTGIAEALGVSDEMAGWIRSDELPDAADLLFAWADVQ